MVNTITFAKNAVVLPQGYSIVFALKGKVEAE